MAPQWQPPVIIACSPLSLQGHSPSPPPRHPGESRDPLIYKRDAAKWIPAFAKGFRRDDEKKCRRILPGHRVLHELTPSAPTGRRVGRRGDQATSSSERDSELMCKSLTTADRSWPGRQSRESVRPSRKRSV